MLSSSNVPVWPFLKNENVLVTAHWKIAVKRWNVAFIVGISNIATALFARRRLLVPDVFRASNSIL